jgi:hypothetical protein
VYLVFALRQERQRSLDDIQQMRSDPRIPEKIGKLAALCEEAKPGSFRVFVTAP